MCLFVMNCVWLGIHLGHPEYCQLYAKAEEGEAGLEEKSSDDEWSEDDDSDADD